jgi:hypothetical protein
MSTAPSLGLFLGLLVHKIGMRTSERKNLRARTTHRKNLRIRITHFCNATSQVYPFGDKACLVCIIHTIQRK